MKERHKSRTRDNKKSNRVFEERKKFCPFSLKNSPKIDYKDIKLLSRYISEKGKMLPSRITNVSSKKQIVLSRAIKRARFLSLMSYTQKI
jgi:small subunit ribosomal protein S18